MCAFLSNIKGPDPSIVRMMIRQYWTSQNAMPGHCSSIYTRCTLNLGDLCMKYIACRKHRRLLGSREAPSASISTCHLCCFPLRMLDISNLFKFSFTVTEGCHFCFSDYISFLLQSLIHFFSEICCMIFVPGFHLYLALQ